jgi:hypothetical protein
LDCCAQSWRLVFCWYRASPVLYFAPGRREQFSLEIGRDVTARDIIALGALLAQQLPNDRGPDQAPRRLKAFFLDGLAPTAR